MLRGRHRILPAAVDRAVLVPGQGLMERLDRELTAVKTGGAEPVVSKEDEERIREVERGGQAERGEGKVDTDEEDKEEGRRNGESDRGAIGREWNGSARGLREEI